MCKSLIIFLEILPNFFVSLTVDIKKDGLYCLFYHTICNFTISNIFDWSIYIFAHWPWSLGVAVGGVCCFLASNANRVCFSIIRSTGLVVSIRSDVIVLIWCGVCIVLFRIMCLKLLSGR